jgi:putative transcriptional regulator
MNKVYSSIISGLNETIEYEKGNLNSVKKHKVTVSPLPHFEGDQIKKIRADMNLSQRLFADILGVSLKTVEAWEAGKNVPQGPAQRMLELFAKDAGILEKYAIMSRN